MNSNQKALEAAKDALIGHGAECKDVNDALALIDAELAKQPPHAICRECETVAHCTNHGCIPKQPAQRKPMTDWVPVTQELLNEQHEWLYMPMWIAMKDGSLLQGHYEWRQGWNPDRFLADGGDHWAFDAAYVMPIVKPNPPTIKTAHDIKDST